MDRIPQKTNPKMFDLAVLPIQKALAANLPWLDHAIGICEQLTDIKNKKPFNFAALYLSNEQYEQIMPCEELGNFSFFYLRDPQVLMPKDKNLVKSPYSLVLWYDLTKVSLPTDERNREQIKGQIMGILNALRIPYFTITRIFEKPSNVFADFSYVHTDNQFLMHPYAGLRIDGEIVARVDCLRPASADGDSYGKSFDNSFDR